MKYSGVVPALVAVTALAGCVAVPVQQPYYAAPAYYYAPPPPVYYGPSLGFSVYGRLGGGHRHWR